MATKPTPGGSDGTYGTELNAFLDESLASDGKIKTEALQTDATAPVADAAVANKKYVDSGAESVIKAWATFAGTGSVQDSFNVTSVNKDSTGTYTITWATDFTNSTYCVIGIPNNSAAACNLLSRATGSCAIESRNASGTLTDAALNVMAIGDQ